MVLEVMHQLPLHCLLLPKGIPIYIYLGSLLPVTMHLWVQYLQHGERNTAPIKFPQMYTRQQTLTEYTQINYSLRNMSYENTLTNKVGFWLLQSFRAIQLSFLQVRLAKGVGSNCFFIIEISFEFLQNSHSEFLFPLLLQHRLSLISPTYLFLSYTYCFLSSPLQHKSHLGVYTKYGSEIS